MDPLFHFFLVASLMIASGIVLVAFRQSIVLPRFKHLVRMERDDAIPRPELHRYRRASDPWEMWRHRPMWNPDPKRFEIGKGAKGESGPENNLGRTIPQTETPNASVKADGWPGTETPIGQEREMDTNNSLKEIRHHLVSISRGRNASASAEFGLKKGRQDIYACARGHFCRRQMLKGAMFTVARKKYHVTFHQIRTELIRNLSETSERAFRRMLHDPGHVTSYRATGAAILEEDGGYKLVHRIWDSEAERRFLDDNDSLNTWPENYLLHQHLDKNYQPRSKGYILGIPTTTNCRFNNIKLYKTDGPMDPRLIRLNESHVFLLFHIWKFAEIQDRENRKVEGHMYLWSFHDNSLLGLDIPGFKLMTTEINWSPFVKDGQLHFVYSFDPLRILRCPLEGRRAGRCNFVYVQQGAFEHNFSRDEDHLRGGTPLVEYQWPYYVTFTHSQFIDPITEELSYKSHFAVIRVEPFKFVYLSQPIKLSSHIYRGIPIVRRHLISKHFFFPIGIVLLDGDRADVSVHINDYSGHVIRIAGLQKIMDDVIEMDRRQPKHIEPQARMVQKALISLLS